jgi:hypothetical protein
MEHEDGRKLSNVSKTWSIYRAEGEAAAIKGKQRGRQFGEDRHLSSEQEKEIQKKSIDRRPEQLKLDFALWTREAVHLLIQQEYHFTMPIRTEGVGSCTPVRTKANLKASATNHISMVWQRPERIMSYFKDPAIHYASSSF